MQIHRFRDAAGVSAGRGETVYLTADEAARAGQALLAVAASIRSESFVRSPNLTVSIAALSGTERLPKLERAENDTAPGLAPVPLVLALSAPAADALADCADVGLDGLEAPPAVSDEVTAAVERIRAASR